MVEWGLGVSFAVLAIGLLLFWASLLLKRRRLWLAAIVMMMAGAAMGVVTMTVTTFIK